MTRQTQQSDTNNGSGNKSLREETFALEHCQNEQKHGIILAVTSRVLIIKSTNAFIRGKKIVYGNQQLTVASF